MMQYYWLILTLTILILASIEDLKHRLIPDKYWGILLLLGFPSYLFWFLSEADSEEQIVSIINIILSIIIAFVLFILGSFGGGDSKALIVISFTTPITRKGFNILFIEFKPFPSIFAILLFLLLNFLIFAFLLLIRNLLEIPKYGNLFKYTDGTIIAKLNTLLSSRRIHKSNFTTLKHSDPAEIFQNEKWVLYAPVFQAPIEDDEAIKLENEIRHQVIEDALNTNREYIWFRPQPPGLIFITISYVIWIIFGSPLSFG